MGLTRFLACALAFGGGLFAQAQYGSLSGRVTDSSSAVIPGVAVAVVNADTGQSLAITTAADGSFAFPQILPGTYDLNVEHTGFKRLQITGIKIDISQNITRDLVLEIGAVTESVSVQSSAVMVETVSGAVGHVIDNKEILELPLNGRNVFNLVNLTPGAFWRGGEVSIAGGRTGSALAMLDGTMNSRGGIAAQNIEINPPVDIMQEFRVEANSYSAQYGRSNAGIVNATTRSGTNAFHGVIYEFLRNDVIDSRGWNADVKAPLRRNQFGGSLGGPILRNRTFFFYNADAFIERRGIVRTRTVPLAAWRQGDLSSVTRRQNTPAGPVPQPLVVYDPATDQRQPFPGNIIPTNRLDPVALKVISFVPLPNRPPDNPIVQGGNWQENAADSLNRVHHTIRIDHSFGDRTKVFGRYILVQPDENPTGTTPGFGDADTDAIDIKNRRQNFAFNATHVFSPTTFGIFRLGVNRVYILRAGIGLGENWPEKLGVKGVAPDVFPRFNMSNGLVPTTNFGTPGNHNRRAGITGYEAHADFNLIRGAHALKLGATHMRFHANEQSRQFASGQFIFNTRFTNGRNAQGGTIANTGMTLADFLLGRLNQVNTEFSQGNGRRSDYTAGYFEDSWKASGSLTLNFGLRYEVESPFYEVANRMNNFDPSVVHPLAGTGDIPAGARGVITFPGRSGYGRRLINWDLNNFSPRFSFNWRVFGSNSTVVRGGFGIFYGNPYDRNVFQIAGLGFDAVGTFRDPVPFTLQQGLPPNALVSPSEADLTLAFGARGTRFPVSQIQWLDPNRRTQYNENFNLSVQRQCKDVLFELGYVGNLGRKVTFPNINLNHVPPELLSRTEIPIRLRRPYTQFDSDRAQIQIISPNWGLSNYHAFTFKTERRFANGIGWLLSYTWSKWIDNMVFTGGDDATFGDNDQIQNIYDLRNERSLSTNHIPHRAVISPIVELPFGSGKKWMNVRGPLDWVLGGWQISGIVTLQSGSPFGTTVVNGPRDILGDDADGTNLRPDIVGRIELPGDQRGTPAVGQRGIQWFNPDAFAPPARFTHGNAARTIMLGPGFVNIDSAVTKNFRFFERYRLQFRWEAFNATNTPNFGLPGSGLGSGGFGISGAGASDREMQFALKLYF
ncbi:MAG: carboxypeptidase regulatory-like domain-containing protein [Acidobacteria bacterium]|nr:carboxypeptidase regulatory-like domain-containing protein [Acidobacteriota bacterium]